MLAILIETCFKSKRENLAAALGTKRFFHGKEDWKMILFYKTRSLSLSLSSFHRQQLINALGLRSKNRTYPYLRRFFGAPRISKGQIVCMEIPPDLRQPT